MYFTKYCVSGTELRDITDRTVQGPRALLRERKTLNHLACSSTHVLLNILCPQRRTDKDGLFYAHTLRV
jgi:hypothetical protein